ncbi:hypothetical protein E3N88_39943 [Mikania micrantha]|uniref:C2H2-type domain-containing protein n=1 Tax=Mikania micrantha TaxID=192012 RepID=A0A5N6LLB0_9ASTR|nr:hypothetical protein E3N88_39943 [Mikania micrantha]
MVDKVVPDQEIIVSNGVTNTNNSSSFPPTIKRKRNLPGTPGNLNTILNPEAEVIALSPKTLMATNRFMCEICGKGFQRDQNLQLHRRGHNLPWKLKQRSSKELVRKRVYVCPEKTCVHNHPSRALGDLTGIKKHFCRKHGEKKWKCAKCSKCYAVQSDWKAHSKTCGTREYKCDCGTIFSRKDSFITHRAFCDALAEETARMTSTSHFNNLPPASSLGSINYHFVGPPVLAGPTMAQQLPSNIFKPVSTNQDITRQDGLSLWTSNNNNSNNNKELPDMRQLGYQNLPTHSEYQTNWGVLGMKTTLDHDVNLNAPSLFATLNNVHQAHPIASMSATALLQKAAQIGSTSSATTTDSLFLVDSNNNCNVGTTMVASATTHIQDHHGLNGLYGTSPMMNNYCASDLENDFSRLDETYPPSKRRHIHIEEHNGGQTRDFLGVGIQPICHPRIRFDHV